MTSGEDILKTAMKTTGLNFDDIPFIDDDECEPSISPGSIIKDVFSGIHMHCGDKVWYWYMITQIYSHLAHSNEPLPSKAVRDEKSETGTDVSKGDKTGTTSKGKAYLITRKEFLLSIYISSCRYNMIVITDDSTVENTPPEFEGGVQNITGESAADADLVFKVPEPIEAVRHSTPKEVQSSEGETKKLAHNDVQTAGIIQQIAEGAVRNYT